VSAVGFSVGVASELPVVRQPGVGALDDPALSQRFGLGSAPGLAGRAFGGAHDVVDAPASAGLRWGVSGVAAVEVDGLDLLEQPGVGDGGQGGLQKHRVVAVRAGDRPADGDAAPFCRDRPLPPQFPPVNRAFAGPLAAAGGLVDRRIHRRVRQVHPHDAVIAAEGLGHQRVERSVGVPLVVAGAQRRAP